MDSEEEGAPKHLLRRIDRAFDAITGAKRPRKENGDDLVAPPTVRRRRGDAALAEASGSSSFGAGGFLPPSPPTGGGFLLDDQEPEDQPTAITNSTASHIPLSKIPAALQLLDLPPADEEVLQVFQNAAGGWDGSRTGDDGEMGVSRKDFRAVCLVLFGAEEEEEPASEEDNEDDTRMEEDENEMEEEDDSSEDQEYKEDAASNESAEEVESEDEYMAKPKKGAVKTKGKGKGKRSKRTVESSDEEPPTITRRQKAACREAFSLFFPDVENKDLDSQRIMIKDIARVSELLKEKITAEEVMEMLQQFSTAPDKSMSLADFERMMMAAKLA